MRTHRPLWGPVLTGIAAVIAVGLAGYFPTVRLAGPAARWALLAGCGVGLLANWVGFIAIAAAGGDDPRRRAIAILMGTAVRFGTVMILAVAAALSGFFVNSALLIWVALSYLVVLLVDTLWLMRIEGTSVETQ